MRFYRQQQSHRLEKRFGSEYHRALDGYGSRSKAEAELRAREKRVKQLNIVPLMPDDANRFTQSWKALQARFIDDPKGVVSEADQLVREYVLPHARNFYAELSSEGLERTRTIAAWLICSRLSSPAFRPSRRTVTRSATACTSASRCEI